MRSSGSFFALKSWSFDQMGDCHMDCQFWTNVDVKKVNGIAKLQALVDKKKVVVTEATIRDALRLDDAEGKGFSRVDTPLFEGMLVAQEASEGDADKNVEDVNVAGVIAEGNASVADDEVNTAVEEPIVPSPTPHTCTILTRRVEHLKQDKIAQALEITKLKQRVKKLERRNNVMMIAEMDAYDDVVLEEAKNFVDDIIKDVQDAYEDESEPVKVQEVVDVVTTAKIITKIVTTASDTITAASTNITTVDAQVPASITTAAPSRLTAAPRRRKGVVIMDPEESTTTSTIILAETKSKDKGKGILAKEDPAVKRYQALKRKPQTKAQARKNMMIYLKNVAGFKMDYFKRMSYDDTNFDKEDLEALWRLVKEIFATTKPKNFSDDFLLITLGAMFENPDIHAQIWKNQRSVHGQEKVKSWKLLESCGVQIITFTTTWLILLVERKYTLTKFTLNHMLNNVRLEVEEESKVSLELLRFIRQQHQEGAQLE
uniref:Uncharacterized protein n=1 Tax=Tanacetum cinerariifolium TaxID=118510 RepID=A0A6L2KPD2_TANCI|nr:hypothetical protein [Tanacetum cinerariifolium]